MLYMKGDGVRIIVLESANMDEIRSGRPARTPDGEVLVCWTPDLAWLAEQIAATDGDAAEIARLIDEAARRPEAGARLYHAPEWRDLGGES